MDEVPIRPMTQSTKQGDFVTYIDSKSIVSYVSFRFTTSPPPSIQLQVYYCGANSTPLIDGFLVQKNSAKVELYFLQITVSQHKKNRSASGQELVKAIVDKVKMMFVTGRDQLSISFVMIQPQFGNHTATTWELPRLDTLDYDVYHCYLNLPPSTPALVRRL